MRVLFSVSWHRAHAHGSKGNDSGSSKVQNLPLAGASGRASASSGALSARGAGSAAEDLGLVERDDEFAPEARLAVEDDLVEGHKVGVDLLVGVDLGLVHALEEVRVEVRLAELEELVADLVHAGLVHVVAEVDVGLAARLGVRDGRRDASVVELALDLDRDNLRITYGVE